MRFASKRFWLIWTLVLSAVTGPSAAADIFVITNSSMTISESDVADIFLGNTHTMDGKKIVALDNRAAQSEFLAKVLKISAVKYNATWAKKAFSEAIETPPVKGSDADVLAFVKKNSGAVGYVSAKPEGVKIVKQY